ncbi:tRNA modification GTPase [Flavobacterium sp. C3NV]|uniref:tRNA modification GTPase n=1 Tax=Flavobacterium sp. C3NV TaxID=3393358 RepID=UPI003990293C
MIKNFTLLALFFIFSHNCYSQIIFENGYFINENDQKITCLIENQDWKNNPSNFKYKLGDNQQIITADIKTIKEFAVDGQSKFIRGIVKIDRSGKKIESMSKVKNPEFNEEKLFLKALIEGQASLYIYDDGNLRRFFYKNNNGEIKQLVHKLYLENDYSIAKNNYFREQLYIDFKCDNITQREYESLTYEKKDLEKFFIKYNKCNDSNFVNYEVSEKKDLFNLNVRPRINSSSLSVSNSMSDTFDFKFDNNTNVSLGIEAEFILPFNKNKWAIIVEPTYQYYNTEKKEQDANFLGGEVVGKVDYTSIELPVGIRHYFFLKNGFKIFANASVVFDFSSKSKMEFTRIDGSEINSIDIKSGSGFSIGIGGKIKDKYSLEFRYQTGRGILENYVTWNSSFKTASLILGYSFF